MREQIRRKAVAGGALLSTVLLGSLLLAACQSTPAASPTAAPVAPTKAAAAPTSAPAAPTAAPAAAATAAPAAPTAAPAAAATVKIGHMPALTGAMAASGEPGGKGINDYFQWINDQGGLAYKDPKTGQTLRAKLDVTSEDTGYEATRGLNVYNKQKAAGVKAIIGMGGPLIVGLAEQVSKDKIPTIFIGSPTADSLKPTPRYMMTSSTPYNKQAMAFVKYIKDNWKESRAPILGLTYFDNTAGIAGTAGVPEYAKSIGWQVLTPEAVAEPATDTSIQVRRLLAGKPDYVYSTNTSGAVGVMMKDAIRLGVLGNTQWVVMGPAYNTDTFMKVAPVESNGVMSLVYNAAPEEQTLAGVKQADAISRKYQNIALTDANYLYYQGLAAVLVNGGIKGALEKVGADAVTGEAVRNAMFSSKDVDSGGIYPPLTMTEEKPWVMSKGRLVQLKDGKTKVLTDWLPSAD